MSNSKLSNRLDAQQDHSDNIVDDTSLPTGSGETFVNDLSSDEGSYYSTEGRFSPDRLNNIVGEGETPVNDDWGNGEWPYDSTEKRYFSPFEEAHPLCCFGAKRYTGVCPCEKGGDRPVCSFHYPNGHADEEVHHKPASAQPTQELVDCGICNDSKDFPCLKCSTVK